MDNMIKFEMQIIFGEPHRVIRNVRLGSKDVEIHPDDVVVQQYGPSKTKQFLVKSVDVNSVNLYPGADNEINNFGLNALFHAILCPMSHNR